MNEPKWTTHRVTMPDDMALEYLDKLLVVVNKQFLDPGFHIALSMAIDKMRAPLPDNKPLTVEELRGMGGKPVWIDDWYQNFNGWELSADADDYFNDRDVSKYGGQWSAYRRPPEKGE